MNGFVELESGLVFETSHPEWHTGGKILSNDEGKRKQKDYAFTQLKNTLKQGDTVFKPRYLTGWIAHAMGYKLHKDGGVVIKGGGMDMGFHVVYCLSRRLFPEGFKNEINEIRDGGYALRHEWI
jgi:hypothetical protein